jgi:hypothetical protein
MTSLEQVASSCLSDVGYDHRARVLMLGFQHGAVYRYCDVPSFIYEGLMTAPSLGRFLAPVIAVDSYPA